MAEIKAELSEKDRRFRNFALNGNMWRVVAAISIPLMAYQGLMNIFKILDTIMASHISTDAVSSVAYISQISYLISAVGTGISIGGGMKISEAYGAGNYALVKKRVSTIYAICGIISAFVLMMIPFAEFFLRLGGTTDSMIAVGTQYFAVELGAIVLNFFNAVYIAVERARGNSKLILRLNIVTLVLKLGLTALFVYALNGDVVTIAAATLISQLVFFLIALRNMSDRTSPFGFSIRAISFRGNTALPMVKTAVPAAAERAAFAYGKLIVNSMCTVYGDSTVGALGVSNNIGGLTTSLQNGFQEGGASIISQNIGAGNHLRALDAFKKTLIINIGIGIFFTIVIMFNLDFVCGIFSGGDEEFRLLIKSVSQYEILGMITLGINAAVMALLYGYGYTKLTLLLNGARVFVFRVPVLWYLQNFTDLGSESAGIVMLVSNVSVGVLASVAAFFAIRRIKRKYIKNSDNDDNNDKKTGMITVAQDGSGDFRTISQAIAMAKPGDKILVKPGVYSERAEILTPDITIEGENAENTVLTSAFYARMKAPDGGKLGTFRSYTMLVNTSGFTCRNLTVANTSGFGSEVGQAIAVYAEGGGITFEDCRILGHQDTLFTGPLPYKEYEKGGFKGPTEFAPRIPGNQLYRRCYIEGEVDFIFGSAHAVFDECELFSLNCGKEINGYVTAASTYSGEEYGYIFRNCRFTSDCPAETVYLGRPWRNYAQTVLLNCEIGAHIRAEAFDDWGKTDARGTVFYGMHGCGGDGFHPDRLAPFVKLLSDSEAEKFEEIIRKSYGQ